MFSPALHALRAAIQSLKSAPSVTTAIRTVDNHAAQDGAFPPVLPDALLNSPLADEVLLWEADVAAQGQVTSMSCVPLRRPAVRPRALHAMTSRRLQRAQMRAVRAQMTGPTAPMPGQVLPRRRCCPIGGRRMEAVWAWTAGP